ncbi:MAG: V-type ATP synthase subunit D [Thermodesulfovibrionales bacterium]|nr:V-type ATP synthase subunit D [Thermodesulfovibrionales bacterium]
MIHHTRTNLLLLKEKSRSVEGSIGILKARRQALIQEFLSTVMPFIRSRDEIRNIYGKAIGELSLSLGHEGKDNIESITSAAKRDMGIEITEKSIWGLRYRDVATHETAVRMPDERGYDYFSTTPHLEECINGFERIVELMLELAAFESKLKRLGDEILRTTRKIRVLEERVLPDLKNQIKAISQYLGERERESYYRLKVFKNRKSPSFKI